MHSMWRIRPVQDDVCPSWVFIALIQVTKIIHFVCFVFCVLCFVFCFFSQKNINLKKSWKIYFIYFLHNFSSSPLPLLSHPILSSSPRLVAHERSTLEKDPGRRKDMQIIVRRGTKFLVHKIGRMFSMQHCVYYHCRMNGSATNEQQDLSPMHLCPVCLRKLMVRLVFLVFVFLVFVFLVLLHCFSFKTL